MFLFFVNILTYCVLVKTFLHVLYIIFFAYTESCLLSNDIYQYHYVSQGKITVASIDDSEEFILTDVSGWKI